MVESDHLTDVNTGPGSGWLKNIENKDVWVTSLVSRKPEQSFTLSKIPPSGVRFSLLSELEILSVFVSCLRIQKCFQVLHLVWSTQQSSAQREQILFAGKKEIQRGQREALRATQVESTTCIFRFPVQHKLKSPVTVKILTQGSFYSKDI